MTMTEFLSNRTVGELAAQVPVSIRIFEAWKIDYCCGGRTPLRDACEAAGQSLERFAEALEKAAVVPDASADELNSKSLTELARHIVCAYHEYTREELQLLAPLSEKVLGVHGERRPELARVASLIREVTADMVPHMLKEEQVLFPYVDQLANAGETGAPPPTPFFGTVRNPVRMMMLEHDRVGELLAALNQVTEGYVPPQSACFSYRELYRRLAELEAKTHEHIHVENNIYFPRAVALEEQSGNATAASAAAPAGHACGCGGH